MDKTMLEIAKDYVFNKGYSVIPLIPREKRPIIKWEEYQKRKPTEDELNKWFGKTNNNIGIVTGEISNLSIIDMDGKKAVDYMTTGHDLPMTPMVKTGKDYGYHLYCSFNSALRNFQARNDLPDIDMRSEGGYVVAPPSIHPNGKQYEWVSTPDALALVPSWFLEKALLNNNNNTLYKGVVAKEQQGATLGNIGNILFTEGRRDEDLFHVANAMIKGGLEREYSEKVLNILINSWGENDPKWAASKIESAFNRFQAKTRNITEIVREFVSATSGNFMATELYQMATLATYDEKKAAIVALGRMVKDGKLERCGNKNGCYRRVESEIEESNWIDSDIESIDLCYPFGIENLVLTGKKGIVVIAGTSNAGKTAFLLNMIVNNMNRFPINYFSSEIGKGGMKRRALKFGYDLEDWRGKFKFYERAADFADVIKPNEINIIDYLDVTDEFYKIGGYIKDIFDKLNEGVAIIAIQKNPGNDYGLGGMRSIEKAQIYLSIDPGVIKIIKAKEWVDDKRNPNGLCKNFKLVGGCNIQEVAGSWYRP
jgi:hypothetical protein